MRDAFFVLAVSGIIGAIAGLLVTGRASPAADGCLAACVAGSLVLKLNLGLPVYAGTLLAALAASIIAVNALHRQR
jgi:hypothetical protein